VGCGCPATLKAPTAGSSRPSASARRGCLPSRSGAGAGGGPSGGTPHPAAIRWLGAADSDDLQSVGACLEGAHDLRCNAHDVPLAKLEDLVIQENPTRSGDDDVGLFLLAVAVGHRAAHVGLVAEVPYAEVTRLQVLAAEPTLDPGRALAHGVLD